MIKEEINFIKAVASGNDFILIQAASRNPQSAYSKFARKYCQRKFGIGADGLLVIEPSKRYNFKMRIFNPDGSEAEMCGNGARCAAFWASSKLQTSGSRLKRLEFETKAGIIQAQVSNKRNWGEVKIKMTDPCGLRLNIPLQISGEKLKVNYINTGVPHSIVLVKDVDKINVDKIGREIRFHKAFRPQGTNVDFVKILDSNSIKIRTYERGVEEETLACGTGTAASAVIAGLTQFSGHKLKIKVLTKSGEILKVYFNKNADKITNVRLEGKAYLVYKGQISTD